jgi:RNA polymerase sigma factor (sigma-70 family)
MPVAGSCRKKLLKNKIDCAKFAPRGELCIMTELKDLLTNYAYNITGSYEDARDVVQDVYLEVMNQKGEKIDNPKAYLTRSVINRAINWKKRQKKIVANYPGEWLPEPVATEKADTLLERKDILNYSLMVLLEKLNARQRAVFILKEAFEYEHEEIAGLLGISEENSRKILSRAKKELANKAVINQPETPSGYLERFMEAIQNRDMKSLEQMLTEDITLVSDGGGKASAALQPLVGRERVIAFISGLYHKFYHAVRIDTGLVNHQPALFYYDQGKLVTCQVFILHNGQVTNMYFIRNPDKLQAIQKDLP